MASKDKMPASLVGKKPDEVYRFQFTNLSGNNNKWYTYEVYFTGNNVFHLIGKYGRVGDADDGYQIKDWGVQWDRSLLVKLMSERERVKGYKPVQLHAVAAPGQPTTALAVPDGPIGAIASIILAEAGAGIATYLSTTVDQLSHAQIANGLNTLRDIQQAQAKRTYVDRLIEDYYNTIPTILPRKIDPQEIIDNFDVAQQEIRLQQLDAAISQHQAVQGGATVQQSLGAELEILDENSLEYASLWARIRTTWSSPMRNVNIYRVTIPAERAAYKADNTGKDNVALLFHGTRNEYVMHILRTGLKVPRSHSHGGINGNTFGDAIYLADKAGKSQNYCRVAGKAANPPYMMFLVQASLGKIHKIRGSNLRQPPQGYHSVLAEAYGGYGFNEWMIYRESQLTIRYLVSYF